jgi:hypothetical protein
MTAGTEPKGIVVLGMPRSGTTLLRRLLDAHPDISCPGETGLLGACGRFLEEEEIAGGRIGVVPGLAHLDVPEKDVLAGLREFVFGFHRRHAAAKGKRLWAEKTAFDIFYLAAVERLCGTHVRYLCVVRHGLDVACSIKELCDRNERYFAEIHRYVQRYPRPLEAFSRAWAEATGQLLDLADRRRDDALVVRYEDLVGDPVAVMTRIGDFLGTPWDMSFLSAALDSRESLGLGDWKSYGRSAIDDASIGRWRVLSPGTQALLASIVNPVLARSGYPEVAATGGPTSSDEERRRYELALLIGSRFKK